MLPEYHPFLFFTVKPDVERIGRGDHGKGRKEPWLVRFIHCHQGRVAVFQMVEQRILGPRDPFLNSTARGRPEKASSRAAK